MKRANKDQRWLERVVTGIYTNVIILAILTFYASWMRNIYLAAPGYDTRYQNSSTLRLPSVMSLLSSLIPPSRPTQIQPPLVSVELFSLRFFAGSKTTDCALAIEVDPSEDGVIGIAVVQSISDIAGTLPYANLVA
jgi:hypothetical protein